MKLEAKNLSFSYGKRKVLSDVSFQLDETMMLSLLGRNGSGKTTLLRLLLGFLTPDAGVITIDGKDIREMKERERASLIAYIPQSVNMVYSYTVMNTVLMGRAPALSIFERPGNKDNERAEKALRMLGIWELRDRSINAISGGERQLVLIARALTQDARILLLDEPTASLDYSNQLLVMERAGMLSKDGYTLILSTHDPAQALTYATSVLALSDGGILYSGGPDGLLDGKVLSALYGRELVVREIESEGGRRIVCIPR